MNWSETYLRTREFARITTAFVRLDALDELNYPMALALKYFGRVMPLAAHFFIAVIVAAGGRVLPDRIGGDYFTFGAIGIAIVAMMSASLGGFGHRLQMAQHQGNLETLLVEPVPWSFVPVAMNVWHAANGLASATLILLLAIPLGADFDPSGIVPFAALVFLGSLAASSIGLISASTLVLTKRADPVMRLYNIVAGLLAGAVFPIAILPDWLRPLSWLIPHTYVIAAGRQVLMDAPPEQFVTFEQALVALVIFDIGVLGVGLFAWNRSLEYGRRSGLLGTY